MAPNLSAQVTEIGTAIVAVGLVGGAVLLVIVAMRVMRWTRSTIDSEPTSAERFAASGDDIQEVGSGHEVWDDPVCDNCGESIGLGELGEEELAHQADDGTCFACGFDKNGDPWSHSMERG